jgi:transposase InsO family protein
MVEELSLEQCDVNKACAVFKVSRSGYYDWLKRPVSKQKIANEKLSEKVIDIWKMSRESYGLPRIFNELKNRDFHIGKNRIKKIMKLNNIEGAGKKKFKVMTTDSKHDLPIAKRVFKTESHDIQVTSPNQFWGGDITYVPTAEGWLYLSIFLDLFTRKVVGHAMSESMTCGLVIASLDMALNRQGVGINDGLTTHTDRGSQYAADDYRAKLEAHKITASMSRKGNCYDNAFVESFFRSLKVELVYRTAFKTRAEAKAAIFEFIEVWYNRQRLHSSLGYQTPMEYERQQLNVA